MRKKFKEYAKYIIGMKSELPTKEDNLEEIKNKQRTIMGVIMRVLKHILTVLGCQFILALLSVLVFIAGIGVGLPGTLIVMTMVNIIKQIDNITSFIIVILEKLVLMMMRFKEKLINLNQK